MPCNHQWAKNIATVYYVTICVCRVLCSVLSDSLWPLFTVACQIPPGIFQERILEWFAISSSRGSSRPRYWTCDSDVSSLAGRFLTTVPPGKPQILSRAVLCLVAQSCLTLCEPLDYSLPGSTLHGDSPGKNTGVGCHDLLQEIFPTPG